ncbi:EAL domain-containing protein [Thiosulfativibrio zosterae]|uniref:GGDEF-domain containing protein n=1 Tax=Thiosulfativibrio zosterae TaxID=2675053 RepID=A0A6F8PR39_9GAMM|nr:EAL domain-containing protein [Thiosulfativibrio zosterae]BBP44504.1 hypothetical protein THMIRHAT_22500 [Thiosulfativibrio zosterae]
MTYFGNNNLNSDFDKAYHKLLDEIVSQTSVAFYVLNLKNHSIEFTNNAFNSLFACQSGYFHKKDFSLFKDFLTEEDYLCFFKIHFQSYIRLTRAKPNKTVQEINILDKNLKQRTLKVSISSLSLSQDCKPSHVLVQLIDITIQKNREKELIESEKILHFISHHDALTELPNRKLLIHYLNDSILDFEKKQEGFTVIFFDIDNFKNINDSYGHKVGDSVLLAFSQRIKEVIYPGDILGRLAGDEFVLIAFNVSTDQQIESLAKKIILQFKKMIEIDELKFLVTCSLGISKFPDDGKTPGDLIKNADIAMYHAKRNGKNFYKTYEPNMTLEIFKRLETEREMMNAINEEQFEVYYQPQVNINTNEVVGLEALIRWNHPTKGLINPDDFIPIAEELRLIIPLGEFVFHRSCQQVQTLIDENLFNGYLSINVSGVQIERGNFVEFVKDSLGKTLFEPTKIELEITESVIMNDTKSWIDVLNNLKSIGCKVAIDDFGKGYSSLTHLSNLPIDKIKIDKAFIDDISETQNSRLITEIVMFLAKKMDLTPFAEGVESEVQRDILMSLGCEFVQGYFFSKPKSFNDIKNWLKSVRDTQCLEN